VHDPRHPSVTRGPGRTRQAHQTPTVLSIAGSDPSGGAGVQADLKTFSALGAYGAAVLAGLTAQNTQGVLGVRAIPAEFVTEQIDAVCTDLDVQAVKTGMLGSPDVVVAVAEAISRHRIPHVVVDPVMVAASGDRLVSAETVGTIRRELLPVATVITPNLPEAATLAEVATPNAAHDAVDPAELAALGHAMRRHTSSAILVKGGHAGGERAVDVLVGDGYEHVLDEARTATTNTHGTGCTLSSAIAVGLAHGQSLHRAALMAKEYLSAAIAAADDLQIGAGAGPVQHFHAWWRPHSPGGPRRE